MTVETIRAVKTIIDNGEVPEAIELLLKLYDVTTYGDRIIAVDLRSKDFQDKYDNEYVLCSESC